MSTTWGQDVRDALVVCYVMFIGITVQWLKVDRCELVCCDMRVIPVGDTVKSM